jgi:hypothetical protein
MDEQQVQDTKMDEQQVQDAEIDEQQVQGGQRVVRQRKSLSERDRYATYVAVQTLYPKIRLATKAIEQ